jgi:translocation and assembly module TamA
MIGLKTSFFSIPASKLLLLAMIWSSSFALQAIDNKMVRVEVIGTKVKPLKRHLMKATSIPSVRQDYQYWHQADLKRAIQEEIPRWQKIIHAWGFFDAQINVRLKETVYYWVIELSVAQGRVYYLNQIDLRLLEGGRERAVDLPISFKLGHATVALISDLQEKVLAHFRNNGYAKAQFISKNLKINTLEKTATVGWVIDRGPFYSFGAVEIQGQKLIKDSYISKKILFKKGDTYNQYLVEQTQVALENSAQFNAVSISPQWNLENQKTLPLLLSVHEAKRRTIAFGANLMSDSGIGGKLSWENRNFTGYGDLLALRAFSSKNQRKSYLLYQRPDFLTDQTTLKCQFEFNDEDTRSYDERNWEASLALNQRMNKQLSYGYGASLQLLKTSHSQSDSSKVLISLPLSLKWSSEESSSPTKFKHSHQLQFTPYATLGRDRIHYLKCTLKNGLYFSFSEDLILALGLQAGSMLGASQQNIPPPLRFFKGGPNAFRGYSYKTVSPLDSQKIPVGGSHYYLIAFEPRMKIDEEITIVPFYEAGKVYNRGESFPSSTWLQSVGVGARINTLIGPIRFDFAFPLNKRSHLDSFFQIYLSIGSAF